MASVLGLHESGGLRVQRKSFILAVSPVSRVTRVIFHDDGHPGISSTIGSPQQTLKSHQSGLRSL